MKLYNNKTIGKIKKLKKRQRMVLIRSLVLTVFVFGVNIFAWFTYFSKADVNVESSVVSWNVDFFDNSTEVKEVTIKSDDIFPGMDPYTKTINIKNGGDVNAKFSYEVEEFNIAGINSLSSNLSDDEINNYLNNYYPFKILLTSTNSNIAKGDSTEFKINISWDYEDDNSYYRVNNLYNYSDALTYFYNNSNTYIIDPTINSLNYVSKVQNGLYLQKDDADGYWGEVCSVYQKQYNKPCVNVKLKLLVEQA